jgi:hypothetical protein
MAKKLVFANNPLLSGPALSERERALSHFMTLRERELSHTLYDVEKR